MTKRRAPRKSSPTRKKAPRSRKAKAEPRRAERAPALTRQTATLGQPREESPTVLIIEDEDVVRSFIREALQGAGFATVEARNGAEGLKRYRRAPTAMVITDLVMPEAGGQEVILELTWETPAAKVLAISGESGDPVFLGMAERFGACRTLTKPFTRHQLLQVVKEVLGEQRKYVRLQANVPISFEGDGITGKGSVIDISRGGCAVESESAVPAGAYLRVALHLTDPQPMLAVDLAAVRWSKGSAFGLEFIRMGTEAQERLRHYLQSLCRSR